MVWFDALKACLVWIVLGSCCLLGVDRARIVLSARCGSCSLRCHAKGGGGIGTPHIGSLVPPLHFFLAMPRLSISVCIFPASLCYVPFVLFPVWYCVYMFEFQHFVLRGVYLLCVWYLVCLCLLLVCFLYN